MPAPISQRKAEANRRNAAKSTGPRTPEGKAAASRNATTHGLTSTSPVVLDESREEFDAFADALRADLRPRGAMQRVLVDRIVHLSWKLRRVPTAEAETLLTLERSMQPLGLARDEDRPRDTVAKTVAWDLRIGQLARLQAYESRIDRSLHACLRELAKLQKLRADDPARQNEPTAEAEQLPPSPCNQGEGGGEGSPDQPADAIVQNEATASVPHGPNASVQNEATASVPHGPNAGVQNEATEAIDRVDIGPLEVADETDVARSPEDPRRGKAVLRVAPDCRCAPLIPSPRATDKGASVD